MNISLTPELEAMIREKVECSLYSNTSEVVCEALRLMQQRDEKEGRLRAALAIGIKDFERGNVVVWTPELMDEIWREGKAAFEAGEPFDPHTRPEEPSVGGG